MSTVPASQGLGSASDRLSGTTRCGVLLAVGASSGALGDFRDSVEVLIYLASAAMAYAGPLAAAWRRPGVSGRLAAIVAVSVVLFVAPWSCEARLAALAASMALLFVGNDALERRQAEVTAWVVAIAATAMFVLLHERSVWLHETVRSAGLVVVGWFSKLMTGKSMAIGPTMLGLPVVCFVVCLQAARIWWSERGRRMWGRDLAVVIAPVLLAPLSYAVAAAWAALPADAVLSSEFAFDTDLLLRRHASLGQFLFPSNVRLLIVAVVLVGELWIARPASGVLRGAPQPAPRWAALCAVGAVLAYLGVAATVLSRHLPAARNPRVLFHDPSTVYFKPPKDGEWGLTVSFAALPSFLQQAGYLVANKPLDRASLAEADVVVMVNLHERLSPDLLAALREWVAGGGALLCLGDHTGDEQIRVPFNEVLADAGIAFEFDSARSLGGWGEASYWLNSHIYPDAEPRHAVTDTSAVGIGASLTLRHPAYPVMVGGNAFSDPGDRKAVDRGMVGNLLYDHGEPLGDLVLVAAANLGQGRILVFGDTSPFQSTALPTTAGFVARVFAWLTRDVPASFEFRHVGLLVILLVAAVMSARWVSGAWCAALLAVGVAAHEFVDGRMREAWDPAGAVTATSPDRIAWIDGYHHSALEPCGEYGLDGLPPNLSRRGWVPRLWQRDWRELPAAGLLVSCDARRRIERAEVDEVMRFLARGGNMLLTVSHESRDAHAELLAALGVEIPFEPLGRCRAKSRLGDGLEVEFVAGWPMRITTPHEPLATPWQHVVAARFVKGEGSLVVIADGRFLRANNLESTGGFVHARNAAFLREVCKLLGAPQ